MKIRVNGVEYDFMLRGTVGLVYLAERMLGAAMEDGNKYHTLVLFYCCLQTSNRGKEIPDLMDFISSLTSKTMAEMSEYFWTEWRRLEGEPAAKEGDGTPGEG